METKKVQGLCFNPNCSFCKNQTQQDAEVDEEGQAFCKECNMPLDIPNSKPLLPIKKIILLSSIALIIGLLSWGGYAFFTQKKIAPPIAVKSENKVIPVDSIKTEKTITNTPLPTDEYSKALKEDLVKIIKGKTLGERVGIAKEVWKKHFASDAYIEYSKNTNPKILSGYFDKGDGENYLTNHLANSRNTIRDVSIIYIDKTERTDGKIGKMKVLEMVEGSALNN